VKVSTEIDRENQRLFVRFVGRVTFGEVEQMIRSSAEAGIVNFPLLIDAQSVTIDLFAEDVNRFGELLRELSAKSKIGNTAVLVSDAVTEHTLHLVSIVAAGICEIRAFGDRGDAERWLGW
jgi:hypothetical protein